MKECHIKETMLANYNRRYIFPMSSCRDEELFRSIIEDKIGPITTVVEIGTHQGVSSVLLAEYAREVHTIDVTDYPDRENVWNTFGTQNAIFHLIKDDKEKARILKELDFDFAFVDGRHGDTAAIDDFELVKHCGRVLFHDYHKGFDYDNIRSCVVRAVDSIKEGKIYRCEPFAYWTK